MGAIPYTRRRGKAGTFYFKRRAPKEALDGLRATVWRDTPTRTHWDTSLKTRDWNEAFKRAARHVEETDALIAGALGQVREAQEADNAAQRRAQTLTEAESRLVDPDPAERATVASPGGVAALEVDALENAGWANMMANAEAMAADNPSERPLSHDETVEAQIDAARDRAAAIEAKRIVQTQTRILAKLGLDLDAKLNAFRETEPGLSDVLAHLVRERGLPEQTERQYGYAVRRFTELHGDIPAHTVTRDHFRTFAHSRMRSAIFRRVGRTAYRTCLSRRRWITPRPRGCRLSRTPRGRST